MQLFNRIQILSALSALLILASCSKTNTVGRMVPKEAGFVMHFSGKSFSSKVNMAEIRETDWYKQFVLDTKSDSTQNELMKKIGDNAKNAGIDSLGDIIFFADYSRTDSTYMVVQAALKDAGAFEKFLRNIYPQGSISKDGGLQFMTIENKAVISWNNEKAMAGFKAPSMNSYRGYFPDDSAVVENNIPQIASYCKNLFALKEDNSMAADDKFTDMVNTEGDMHCYFNIGKMMSGIPQMGAMSMLKMDNFIEGNISTYTLNFDNGKITLKSKGYYGKELDKIMKKYAGGSINTAMLKNIPSTDLVGVMAMHFNPEGLKEIVKLTGMDGFLDLMLARNGFTTDDFIRGNKGDIMIAVSDLKLKKDTFSMPLDNGKSEPIINDNPDAKFIFSVAINDKEAFNKLINFGKKVTGDKAANMKISFNTNKEYFAISNSADYISRYLAGGNTDLPWMSKISANPIGIYIDLQKIMKVFASAKGMDSISQKIMDASLKLWDNVTVSGGNYNSGGTEQILEMNMVDKTTNSLKQMMKYLALMTSLEKQMIKPYVVDNARPGIDSVAPVKIPVDIEKVN